MAREYNTNRNDSSFDDDTIEKVWNKGEIVRGTDKDERRKDSCGAWIDRDKYGETSSNGWEIDHIKPVAQGGGDEIDNLQPLQWENNRHKSDDYPERDCKIT